jgi:hypothetical protein
MQTFTKRTIKTITVVENSGKRRNITIVLLELQTIVKGKAKLSLINSSTSCKCPFDNVNFILLASDNHV